MNLSLKQDVSLLPYNTFGIDAKAAWVADIYSIQELRAVLEHPEVASLPRMVLGGGSNILLTQDYPGLMIHMRISGRNVVAESESQVTVEFGAGENWHETVQYCIDQDWGGIENLSLIPGKVGAAPIQNIGAYGVELKDVFAYLDLLHLESGEIERFHKEDCAFGYRDSVFKRSLKGKVAILKVAFHLSKAPHSLQTSYGIIVQELEARGITEPTIRDVGNVVTHIRRTKLPDPAKIGNGGSFFKNPEVSVAFHDALKARFPGMPSYPVNPERRKIPAAWLIDQAGWKGQTFGKYGVHKNQALVLVNYGGANGQDIYDLSTRILGSVWERYRIELEREVNVI
ncbi:UNVERIFIED_CONTAM: hypothetical protein GTU68_029163 [Idotea baltica]|nr:hypothetical protein [Idotea baltica]